MTSSLSVSAPRVVSQYVKRHGFDAVRLLKVSQNRGKVSSGYAEVTQAGT